jgi:hypothetical protein
MITTGRERIASVADRASSRIGLFASTTATSKNSTITTITASATTTAIRSREVETTYIMDSLPLNIVDDGAYNLEVDNMEDCNDDVNEENEIEYSDDISIKSSSNSSSLQFVGHTIFTSDPLPLPNNNSSNPTSMLMEFFANPDHRRHLLMCEGNDNHNEDESSLPAVEVIPREQRTPQLLQRWAGEAKAARIKSCGKMEPPDFDRDDLLIVKSSGIPFLLGTNILVESIVSAKVVVVATATDSFPGYQFLLIQDTVRIEGSRPLLWLYEKIMSFKDDSQQMTHSYSMVTVQPVVAAAEEEQDTDQRYVTFTSESTIEINIDVPQVMIKMLPLSRETANRQGSAAIQKSFEAKGKPGLDNFIQAYRKWYDDNTQQQQQQQQ